MPDATFANVLNDTILPDNLLYRPFRHLEIVFPFPFLLEWLDFDFPYVAEFAEPHQAFTFGYGTLASMWSVGLTDIAVKNSNIMFATHIFRTMFWAIAIRLTTDELPANPAFVDPAHCFTAIFNQSGIGSFSSTMFPSILFFIILTRNFECSGQALILTWTLWSLSLSFFLPVISNSSVDQPSSMAVHALGFLCELVQLW
jgi:hypothetical protein